jgi:FAD/FMN-containing dehydrogenase
MPYTEIQQLTAFMAQAGWRNYVKTIMVRDIGEAVIDTLVEYFARRPSPYTVLGLQQLGNAANRVEKDATPFYHRDARYELLMHAIWLDPGDDEKNMRWTRELAATILPLTGGSAYINHMATEAEEGADRIRAAFGPNYQRLVALKQKYDPTNLFRHNQNIKPAG